MESLPRNVILDLLPSYIAGEASKESRAIVEEFARHDSEIAGLIRAGSPELTTSKISTPADLEMKTMDRIRRSIRRQMAYVALATACILLIPLVAMQFTNEVDWDAFDFIVMGILLLGTGFTYILVTKTSANAAYRFATGIAVASGLILIWLNLAVGLIGSEDNPANALYAIVLFVGILGAVIANLRARGMARAMFATAIAQFMVPVVALIIWRPSLDDTPGIVGVFILNGFFAMLFTISGMLFRRASDER